MAFNINEMRSQLTFGGAKSSLFEVRITNPINSVADIKVPFMVKAAQLPGSSLGTIEVPYFGRRVKLHGDRVFEPWQVQIINDEDFLIRNALETWMSALNSHQGNIASYTTPAQYKTQAQVTQFSKTGTPLRVYNFNGLFPTELAPIDVAWENTDQIQEYGVVFQYDWWNVDNTFTGDGGTNT
jgi:hypothetical protein